MLRCLLAILLLLPLAGQALAQTILGPQATAREIRDFRNAGPGPEVRLTYRRSIEGRGNDTVVFGLGVEYAYIEEADGIRMIDLLLRREIRMDAERKQFRSRSLYAGVDWRALEAKRREDLREQLKTLPSDSRKEAEARLDPVWQEAETGLILDDSLRSDLKKSEAEGAILFSARGREWARLQYAPQTLSEDHARAFGRLIRHNLPIHPDAGKLFETERRIPRLIGYLQLDGAVARQVSFTFVKSDQATTDYPLPASAALRSPIFEDVAGDEYAELLRELWPTMTEAVRGKAGAGPRRMVETQAEAVKAYNAGRLFETYLRLYEIIFQYGQDGAVCAKNTEPAQCIDFDRVGGNLRRDLRVGQLQGANAAEQGKSIGRAVEQWRGIDRKDLPNGYLIDVFMANGLSAAFTKPAPRPSEESRLANQAYRRAIQQNPYVAGFYSDLGDHFYRAGRTDLAWICYDLARNLPFAPVKDLLAQVDSLEAALVGRYPQFF